jgi:enoyl-CoA hydratase/carnithine racemase
MTTGTVHVAQAGPLARVTLHHAARLNAMSRAMWGELRTVFTALQHDASVRCVLLRGDGGHFCAGGDIAEYPEFRFSEASLREFHEGDVWGGLQALLDCDVPIVAQIAGNCMGAGVEIASCCDLRLAGASARFGAPIARLGFPMAPREAEVVIRAAGAATAREMLLAAAVFDAPTLLQRGFLNRVVADAVLTDAAEALAHTVATLAPQAARLNKRTLRTLQGMPVLANTDDEAIKNIAKQAYHYADSAEHREGVMAFIEKRPPVF